MDYPLAPDLQAALESNRAWSSLDPRLQKAAEALGGTSQSSWEYLVFKHHTHLHVSFSPLWPQHFHRDLLRHLRTQLDLYPYYLAWQIRAVDFPDPFDYYIELLCDALRLSKPYADLPHFTALDILHVVGLTPASYSATLSQCRAKGAAGRISKLIRSLLPVRGQECEVKEWWEVYPLGRGTTRGTATEEELATLQEICEYAQRQTPALARNWPKSHLQGLCSLGVIIFHLPISPSLVFSPPVQSIPEFTSTGFNQVLITVLQALRECRTLEEVMEREPALPRRLVEDALELLCRLGLTEVRESHKAKAVVMVNGAVVGEGVEEGMLISQASFSNLSSTSPESQSFHTLLSTLSQDLDVSLVLTSSPNTRAHLTLSKGNEEFTTEVKTNEALWQVFKLRKQGVKAAWFQMGKVVNALPSELESFDNFWLLMGDETPILLEHWEVLSTLQDALPYQELVLVPYEERQVCPRAEGEGSQVLAVPLPLDAKECGNEGLKQFLMDLGKREKLDLSVGYIELAHTYCASNNSDPWMLSPCCSQSFSLLSNRSGLPLSSPPLLSRILANLRSCAYLQSVGLQRCAEQQQVEVFEFQEKLCLSGSPGKS